jgi:hypothetical protein
MKSFQPKQPKNGKFMQKLWIRWLGLIVVTATLMFLCISGRAQTSVNVVGYVNKQYSNGWSLIANPLNDTLGNTLGSLFQNNLPPGTQVSKLTGTAYDTYRYDGLGWLDANGSVVGSSVALPPGVGAVLHTPILPPQITYVGQVVFTNGPPPNYDIIRIPAKPPTSPGIYLLSSTFPVSSSFADIVGRAPNDGEAVLTINPIGTPTVFSFSLAEGGWVGAGVDPVAGPSVSIAESAFFALNGADFSNWSLPSIVPEPDIFALLALGAVLLFRRHK